MTVMTMASRELGNYGGNLGLAIHRNGEGLGKNNKKGRETVGVVVLPCLVRFMWLFSCNYIPGVGPPFHVTMTGTT